MVKKITISVPDELHDKMQTYKNEFNFSKIFQETMADQIKRKEDFQRRLKEDVDMGATIERLKRQKAELEQDLYEVGKKEGLRFAQSAHYEDLVKAIDLEIIHGTTRDIFDTELFEDYFNEIEEGLGFETRLDIGGITDEFSQYVQGWLEGVQAFWNEVCDKL